MKISRVTAEVYEIPVHREMHDAIREFSILKLHSRERGDQVKGSPGCAPYIYDYSARRLEIRSVIRQSVHAPGSRSNARVSGRNFNLFWFEEPLPTEDILGHAKVKAHTSIPIALGESLFTRQQFKDYIASDGVPIVQPDCCRCGGITEWLKIAHLADCKNMQVSPHFVMELHLPLVAAIPNGLFVEYIPFLNAVFQKPLHLEDGHFRPSQEPGLGVLWDLDKLEHYRVKA